MTAEGAVMLVKRNDLFRRIWLSEQFMYLPIKHYFNVSEFLEK